MQHIKCEILTKSGTLLEGYYVGDLPIDEKAKKIFFGDYLIMKNINMCVMYVRCDDISAIEFAFKVDN